MPERSLTLPIAIAVGGLIVAGAIYLTLSTTEPSTSSGAGDPSLVLPISASDHILGSPAAKVKVVEYADFDCEYCAQFSTTMHQVIAEQGASGQVAWVYRNSPITQLHPNAYHAAEAAECVAQAAGNDAYWRFSDALFAHQPVAPTDYLSYAQSAGADAAAVSACLRNASSTVGATIAAQSANATAIGARGTPYSLIIIPGYPIVVINGAWPYSQMKDAIAAALSEAR